MTAVCSWFVLDHFIAIYIFWMEINCVEHLCQCTFAWLWRLIAANVLACLAFFECVNDSSLSKGKMQTFLKLVFCVCIGVKPYACSMCDMRFFQRYHLASHSLKHTGMGLLTIPISHMLATDGDQEVVYRSSLDKLHRCHYFKASTFTRPLSSNFFIHILVSGTIQTQLTHVLKTSLSIFTWLVQVHTLLV